jgi:serine/threonine-protein kinase
MGTAQYLSPEQAQGRPVTEASDLYSIGVVLFEMLTGKAPFDGDSAVAIALKHVNQPAPSPRQLEPSIPPELEAVVLRALAKDADQRYTDAETFIRDLDAVEARLDQGPVDVESTAVFVPLPPVPVAAPPVALPPVAPVPAATVQEAPPVEAEVIELPPVGGPPLPPAEGSRRPWLWAVGLLALAAIALGGFLALRPAAQVRTPLVVGQTLDSARSEIEGAGLKVDVRRRADRAPADIVFDQAPDPAQEVDKGSSIVVFVSNGPGTVKVPDVIGLTETDARKRIRAAKLRADIQKESSPKVVSGIVIRTDPGAGRPVDSRSVVTLVVSSGPEQVAVPDVTGQTQDDAVARLREAGLSAVVREKPSSEPVNTVVSQTPGAGQQIDQGSTVTLFVSNGKVKEVPDVTGLNQAEAETEITDAGFAPAVRTRSTDQPDQDGTVISQSPSGGTKRKEGATVTITVGQLASAPPAGAAP